MHSNCNFASQLALLLLLLAMVSGMAHAATLRLKQLQRLTADDKTPWELSEALYGTSGLYSFNGTWITDDEFYYTASDRSIHKFDVANQTDSIFVNASFLNTYSDASFTLSPDNTKILVRYNLTEVFRHSYVAQYDIYDIEKNVTIKVHGGQKLHYCAWSPLQDRLAYVYDNNVYIHFNESLELAITDDGINGVVYNGVPDWVYEEEVLSSGSALWWSSDGTKLAVGFFNDTEVETFKYFLYGGGEDEDRQYPEEVDLKYPKTGTANPVVKLRVFDVSKSEPVVEQISAPVDIVTKDHILQSVTWTNASHLLVNWLNRRQNVSSLQSCSYQGDCVEVRRFEEPKGWIKMGTPKCINSGLSCLFTYWIGNWVQIWNLNLQTGLNSWASRGNFTVLNVYGYDELNDQVYYQATQADNPSAYHVYSNDECLSCKLVDRDDVSCRSAGASFSKSFSYYALTCNGPNPMYTRIFEASTRRVQYDWALNNDYRDRLDNKQLPIYHYLNVTLTDGSTGLVKLALPPNFNETQKYPLIVNVYGGPDSVRITNVFTVGYEAFVTTTLGAIYAYIDGRGTGNKGKDLLFSVNNDLGDYEVVDQLNVTKQLQESFSFIDHERTAIWGWSYGGYMTAKIIERDNNRTFQCGVSVAPVTSWLFYDTIYTERYMGLPTVEDNWEKYINSSVLQRLDNFRTHDFLLIHGTGDDNVHFQNSLALAKQLQLNDILFEEQTYTDENHSIRNRLVHLYKTINNFWIRCLDLEIDNAFTFE